MIGLLSPVFPACPWRDCAIASLAQDTIVAPLKFDHKSLAAFISLNSTGEVSGLYFAPIPSLRRRRRYRHRQRPKSLIRSTCMSDAEEEPMYPISPSTRISGRIDLAISTARFDCFRFSSSGSFDASKITSS